MLEGLRAATGIDPTIARNATICMIHEPGDRGAVAGYEPTVFTTSSSAISESGDVRRRLVKPLPAPDVMVVTMFAAKRRSTGLVVVAEPLLLRLPFPLLALVTSTGALGSIP